MSQKPEKKFSKGVAKPIGDVPDLEVDTVYQLLHRDKIDRISKDAIESHIVDSEKWLMNAKELFTYSQNSDFFSRMNFDKPEEDYLYSLHGNASATNEFLESVIHRMCIPNMLESAYNSRLALAPVSLTLILTECANRRPDNGLRKDSYVAHNLALAVYDGALSQHAHASCEYVGMSATLAEMVKSLWSIPHWAPSDDRYEEYESHRQLMEPRDRTIRAMNAYSRTILHFYRNGSIDVPLYKQAHMELARSLYGEVNAHDIYIRMSIQRLQDRDHFRKEQFAFASTGAMFSNPFSQDDNMPF